MQSKENLSCLALRCAVLSQNSKETKIPKTAKQNDSPEKLQTRIRAYTYVPRIFRIAYIASFKSCKPFGVYAFNDAPRLGHTFIVIACCVQVDGQKIKRFHTNL